MLCVREAYKCQPENPFGQFLEFLNSIVHTRALKGCVWPPTWYQALIKIPRANKQSKAKELIYGPYFRSSQPAAAMKSPKGERATWKNYVVCCILWTPFFVNSSCLAIRLDHHFGSIMHLSDAKWAIRDPIDGPLTNSARGHKFHPTQETTKLTSRRAGCLSQVCWLRCERYRDTSGITFILVTWKHWVEKA